MTRGAWIREHRTDLDLHPFRKILRIRMRIRYGFDRLQNLFMISRKIKPISSTDIAIVT